MTDNRVNDIHEFDGFINRKAAKFANASSICDINDLRQAGYVGLLSAQRNFDIQKGSNWKSYASTCINNAIITESVRFLKSITVSPKTALTYYKVRKLKMCYSDEEIKDILSLSDEYYQTIQRLIVNLDNDTINSNKLKYNKNNISDIRTIYDSLKKEEKNILKLRRKKCTFAQIGKSYNKSYEWARLKYKSITSKIEELHNVGID